MPFLSLNAIDISYFGLTRPFFLKGAAGKHLVLGAHEAHGMILDLQISKQGMHGFGSGIMHCIFMYMTTQICGIA